MPTDKPETKTGGRYGSFLQALSQSGPPALSSGPVWWMRMDRVVSQAGGDPETQGNSHLALH